MTTITVNFHSKMSPTPFCNLNYKGIRVFSQFLGRSLYALCLLVASVVCWIFNRNWSYLCFSMAYVQFNRGVNALVAYCKFGDKLINLSYNSCMIAPSADTEQNALRARYGSQVIDQWLQIGTKEIPLRLEKLKRIERGVCLGSTLDFSKQYLEEIQTGISPIEAIYKISSQYITGASDKGQIAQIFYTALDVTRVFERESDQILRAIEELRKDALQWVEEQRKQLLALPQAQLEERLIQVESEYEERINHLRHKALSDRILATAQIEKERVKIISDQLGLRMGSSHIYAYKEMPAKTDEKFYQFLQDLSSGCYAVELRAEGNAHAITLIKISDQQYFLFEPNLGTFAFEKEEIAEKLWNIGKSFYLKNGVCSLNFSSCSLH